MNSIYIVDASVLISLSQNYPKEVFSSLWGNIESLINNKKMLSPKQVYKEIEQGGDDDLTNWCKKYSKMFLENNGIVIKFTKEIISKHSGLINAYATREIADPFIIALARSLTSNLTKSTPVVVTDENEVKVDRIPFVCRDYGITSMKLIGMFQAEKWNF